MLLLLLLLLDLGARHAVRRQEGDQFLLGESEAEGAQGDAEFMIVQMSVTVEIEEGELCLFY